MNSCTLQAFYSKTPAMPLVLLIFLALGLQGCQQGTDFPEPDTVLPRPSGPYAVGTTYFYVEDTERPDLISPEPDDYRTISLQAWYPARPGRADRFALLSDRESIENFVSDGFFKEDILTEWALEPTHSRVNARPRETGTPFPVILYSSSGMMNANTFLAEELASHGYVVFSIGHPYWCMYYLDGEGNPLPFNQNHEYLVRLWEEEGSDAVNETKSRITLAATLEEKADLYRTLNCQMPTEAADLKLWGEDIAFVIDQIKVMNSKRGFFKGRLDTDRVGIMGYSKGGAAAGQYCLNSDPRCRAGINLGGFMFGDIVEQNLQKPFLIMTHMEPWAENGLPIGELFFERSAHDAYMAQIRGGLHGNFTDLSLARDYIVPEGILGPIEGTQFRKIMNDYILTFFDQYVKEDPDSRTEDLSGRYPEVRFTGRRAGVAHQME